MKSIFTTIIILLSCTLHAQIVINELLPNPDGSDTGNEWIELYNKGTEDINLNGWRLERFASTTWLLVYEFGQTEIIHSTGLYTVGGANITSANATKTSLSLGNATSTGNGLRLLNDQGDTIDVVVYGPNNDNLIQDESANIATSIAPKPISGKSIVRVPNGTDTDLSGDDFRSSNIPSLNALDQDFTFGIVINEFMANPDGDDSGHEWIEIVNTANTDINISGWTIESVTTGNWIERFVFPDSVIIEGTWEYLVIGDDSVVDANFSATNLILGNASTTGNGIRLKDKFGTIVDVVIYGPNNDLQLMDESGNIVTELAPTPESGLSIGRLSTNEDTDSGKDFVIDTPTPGRVNNYIVGIENSSKESHDVLVNIESVVFETSTSFSIISSSGRIVSKGFGTMVNIQELPKGSYFIFTENNSYRLLK